MELIKISDLRPNEKNPRRMPKAELEKLKRSIQEFGFVEPVVINNHDDRVNVIVGGHQRVEAAKALGIKEVPIIQVHLPKDKEHLLNLALNRISGEWDEDLLKDIMANLQLTQEDITLSGFEEWEIKKIFTEKEYPEKDLTLLQTNIKCPKCGYEW